MEAAGGNAVRVRFTDAAGRGQAYALSVGATNVLGVPIPFTTANPSVATSSFVESVSRDGGRPVYTRALFDDALFDGRRFEATLDVRADVFASPDQRPDSLSVVLTALSKEAFEFERASRLAREAVSNPFADPVIVSGNVTGGWGLFSGVNAKVVGTLPH